MRLIDADECIEQIKKYCVGCFNYNGVRCRACSFDDAISVVDSMQAIDDAEIRRQTIEECIEKLYEVTPYTYEQKLDMVFVNALKQMKEVRND